MLSSNTATVPRWNQTSTFILDCKFLIHSIGRNSISQLRIIYLTQSTSSYQVEFLFICLLVMYCG